MAAALPTYKFEKKPSVEDDCDIAEHPFYGNTSSSNNAYHFFTQKAIVSNPFRKSNHQLFHDNDESFPSFSPRYGEEPHSDPDEHSKLEYTNTQKISEFERTLEGLCMRKGLSFEREKIDFSLSSEAADTEHENLILRKKVTEMKKEIDFYRDHDDTLFQDTLKYKAAADEAERTVNNLKVQLQDAQKKQQQLQQQLKHYEERLEELQKVLAHSHRRTKTGESVANKSEELQQYKKMAVRHQEELDKMRQHYERELFENSEKSRKMIEELNDKFENARKVGQNQINELVGRIIEKDDQIKLYKQKMAEFDIKFKTSTLMSGHMQRSHSPDKHQETELPNKYIHRFIQFSQFIDQKIHRSCEKDENLPQRVVRSAIQKNKIPRLEDSCRIQMPQSPPNKDGSPNRPQATTIRLKQQSQSFWKTR